MQLFTNREVTPPHELAREGKLEELKATIENYGLTLKEVDEKPAHDVARCSRNGSDAVSHRQRDRQNPTDGKGDTALHVAVFNNQSEAVCILLESKADDTILNKNQDAPLHILFRSQNKDLIAAFLQSPSIELGEAMTSTWL